MTACSDLGLWPRLAGSKEGSLFGFFRLWRTTSLWSLCHRLNDLRQRRNGIGKRVHLIGDSLQIGLLFLGLRPNGRGRLFQRLAGGFHLIEFALLQKLDGRGSIRQRAMADGLALRVTK